MRQSDIKVITLDGPSGTGKGTLVALLAKKLQWHRLDSGAIYRALAFAAIQKKNVLQDSDKLKNLLSETKIHLLPRGFDMPVQVFCNEEEISEAIRDESVGMMAAKLGALAEVREAVLTYQRSFRVAPGLIADGRDMGTVVFPDATLKIYLTASQSVRAQRRYQQLQAAGNDVSLRNVESALALRDQQDSLRAVAPLRPAADAFIIDTSSLNIDQVFDQVMGLIHQLGVLS